MIAIFRYQGMRVRTPLRVLLAIVAACLASQAFAVTVNKTFSFGPGVRNTTESTVFLSVPAQTHTIGVAVDFTSGSCSSSVNLQVFQSSSGSTGSTGPNGTQLFGQPVIPCGLVTIQNVSFNSDFGCPRTFRVRISSPISLPPPTLVGGTVRFVFNVPNAIKPFMESGKLSLDAHSVSTDRTLSGLRFGESTPNRIHLSQNGTFRIRGKWHSDPFTTFNDFQSLAVSLVRPNGTVAATQTGFSIHAPASKTPKLDFTYLETATDALLAGTWKLRVRNDRSVRIVDFNMEKTVDSGLDLSVPDFTSRFSAGCADATGAFSLEPAEASVTTRESLDYAFTWVVPEPLVWTDLGFLKLRVRDGADVVFSLFFNVADRTFATLDEETGAIGHSFAAGSHNSLQTRDAALDLARSSFEGSGPTGTSVTLHLALEFKPHASGHTYSVEVAASNDENEQGVYEPAGAVVVAP